MAVNPRLDAAQAHFGQSAETLSLVLALRQRQVLLNLIGGQWLTTDHTEPRTAFSDRTVMAALEAGLLTVQGTDGKRATLVCLTNDGDGLAGEVLAWLKEQNAPRERQYPPEVVQAWAEIGKDDRGSPFHFYNPKMAEELTKKARRCERKEFFPNTESVTPISPEESQRVKDLDRRLQELQPNIIETARFHKASEVLTAVVEQIGDEVLLDSGYSLDELREQIRAGFERWEVRFDDLLPDHQKQVLDRARVSLEETYGLVADDAAPQEKT